MFPGEWRWKTRSINQQGNISQIKLQNEIYINNYRHRHGKHKPETMSPAVIFFDRFIALVLSSTLKHKPNDPSGGSSCSSFQSPLSPCPHKFSHPAYIDIMLFPKVTVIYQASFVYAILLPEMPPLSPFPLTSNGLQETPQGSLPSGIICFSEPFIGSFTLLPLPSSSPSSHP